MRDVVGEARAAGDNVYLVETSPRVLESLIERLRMAGWRAKIAKWWVVSNATPRAFGIHYDAAVRESA